MKCIFAKFFRCDAADILDYTGHLVRAVNKLYDEIGEPLNHLEHYENTDNRQAMENSINSLRYIAKKLELQRYEHQADEPEKREQGLEIEQLRQLTEQLTIENNNMKLKITDLTERQQAQYDNQTVQTEPGEMPEEVASKIEKRRGLISDLIKFRDQLLYFQDEAEADNDERTITLLKSLYKETGRFMKENGAEPLEESGEFDVSRHVITATVPTNDKTLDDMIESTSRAGYRIDGELYRPQDVVIYTYKS
jgi:molecular chaperone GrpE (heat shock protein)